MLAVEQYAVLNKFKMLYYGAGKTERAPHYLKDGRAVLLLGYFQFHKHLVKFRHSVYLLYYITN